MRGGVSLRAQPVAVLIENLELASEGLGERKDTIGLGEGLGACRIPFVELAHKVVGGLEDNHLLNCNVEVAAALGHIVDSQHHVTADGERHVSISETRAQRVVALGKTTLAQGTAVEHAPVSIKGVVDAHTGKLEFAGCGAAIAQRVSAVTIVGEDLVVRRRHVPSTECGACNSKFALRGVKCFGLLKRNLCLICGIVVLDGVVTTGSNSPCTAGFCRLPVA